MSTHCCRCRARRWAPAKRQIEIRSHRTPNRSKRTRTPPRSRNAGTAVATMRIEIIVYGFTGLLYNLHCTRASPNGYRAVLARRSQGPDAPETARHDTRHAPLAHEPTDHTTIQTFKHTTKHTHTKRTTRNKAIVQACRQEPPLRARIQHTTRWHTRETESPPGSTTRNANRAEVEVLLCCSCMACANAHTYPLSRIPN